MTQQVQSTAPKKTGRSIRPTQARQLLGGISNTTLWRWARERHDGFPKPIKLGPRVTVFNLDELIAWRDAQAQKAV